MTDGRRTGLMPTDAAASVTAVAVVQKPHSRHTTIAMVVGKRTPTDTTGGVGCGVFGVLANVNAYILSGFRERASLCCGTANTVVHVGPLRGC